MNILRLITKIYEASEKYEIISIQEPEVPLYGAPYMFRSPVTFVIPYIKIILVPLLIMLGLLILIRKKKIRNRIALVVVIMCSIMILVVLAFLVYNWYWY